MLGARTGKGNSTSTDSSEARGKDRAWHTTRGEEQTNERRTTKTNDNSKISEVNCSNEPCRGLATPVIFLYMDIGVWDGGRGSDTGRLVTAKYTLQI